MSRPKALVTGASRGIGRAIALKLAEEGYDLVITCRTKYPELQAVAKEIAGKGVSCIPLQTDAGDFHATQAMFKDHIKPAFKGLDLVVNNAGISYMGLLTDMTPDQWRQLMAVNVDSLYNICALAVPMMVSQKSGCIVNISSMWGQTGASCEVAYSASKGAVNAFTKALAKELAPSGIRVNAIACGAIETDMNKWMSFEDRQLLMDEIPMGRMGSPEEIAETVTFLASKKAGYITGQILGADGGI